MTPNVYNALRLLLVCFTTAWCFQLPPYMKRCTFDETVAKCIVDQLPDIKPHFKEEMKELGISALSPYHRPIIVLDVNENLKIKGTNLDILHIDEVETKSFKVNHTTYKFKTVFFFPIMEIIGSYEVDGRVLILPIKGEGPINITITDFIADYSFTLSPENRNGQIYRFPTDQLFKYSTGKISMVLGNLFNGDKILGDQLNNFLNDNWREIELLLRPELVKAVYELVGPVFDKALNAAPFNELFIVP